MTFEEFAENLKLQKQELRAKYLKKFGIEPPNLTELKFLGSEVDILQEAINSNEAIQDIIIPEDADI